VTGDSESAPRLPPGRGDDATALAVFEEHRGLLFAIAYRMLGSFSDAEDMLQETFIRWWRASEADIRSPKAFLVTVVSRLCINHLQSARTQREEYVGEWLPEPLVTERGGDASRPRFRATTGEHRELLERFRRAAGSGDVDQLVSLLSSDVVMHTDGGGKAAALALPIYGPEKVARASVHGLGKLASLNVVQRIVEINGHPGIVSYQDGCPQSVFTVEARDGRIQAIYIVTNPEKLSHLPPPPS